jgi:hypothetical protein
MEDRMQDIISFLSEYGINTTSKNNLKVASAYDSTNLNLSEIEKQNLDILSVLRAINIKTASALPKVVVKNNPLAIGKKAPASSGNFGYSSTGGKVNAFNSFEGMKNSIPAPKPQSDFVVNNPPVIGKKAPASSGNFGYSTTGGKVNAFNSFEGMKGNTTNKGSIPKPTADTTAPKTTPTADTTAPKATSTPTADTTAPKATSTPTANTPSPTTATSGTGAEKGFFSDMGSEIKSMSSKAMDKAKEFSKANPRTATILKYGTPLAAAGGVGFLASRMLSSDNREKKYASVNTNNIFDIASNVAQSKGPEAPQPGRLLLKYMGQYATQPSFLVGAAATGLGLYGVHRAINSTKEPKYGSVNTNNIFDIASNAAQSKGPASPEPGYLLLKYMGQYATQPAFLTGAALTGAGLYGAHRIFNSKKRQDYNYEGY